MRRAMGCCLWAIVLISAGCSGIQSALDPAGREAECIAERMFWWMVGGTVDHLARR
jgi:hypothetical protein